MKLSDLLWREDLTEKFILQKFLCTFLWYSREELWTHADQELSEESIQKILLAYKSYVEDHKPLEYILWHVDFFGKEFMVNEATLIPRPETEYMITAVSEYLQGSHLHHPILLDIWTWCGVLGISVCLQNPWYFDQVFLTDFFANALEVAQHNVAVHLPSYPSLHLLQSDLLCFLQEKQVCLPTDSDVVLVANLPYIPDATFDANVSDNVKDWEPRPAFVWGDDGLDYCKKMIDQIITLRGLDTTHQYIPLFTGHIVCFLEMMTRQVDILRTLYGAYFVFEEVKTFHFNIRIVKLTVK